MFVEHLSPLLRLSKNMPLPSITKYHFPLNHCNQQSYPILLSALVIPPNFMSPANLKAHSQFLVLVTMTILNPYDVEVRSLSRRLGLHTPLPAYISP